jgi:hypothetical protein
LTVDDTISWLDFSNAKFRLGMDHGTGMENGRKIQDKDECH